MVSMDIFHQDPFSMLQLTSAIERASYVPDGIDTLGVFTDKPIMTEAMAVEERNGVLSIIQTSERGTPVSVERTAEKRKLRYFKTPRLTDGDTIWANEIQGIRDFGQETALMQVMTESARRLSGPTGLLSNLRYTMENMRLGAVQGILVDADNTPIFNYFNEFQIAAALPIYFNLQAEVPNSLRPLCNRLKRSMARSSKGLFTPQTRIVGLCGDEFYDDFVNHPDVIRTFLNWSAAADLRSDDTGGAFGTFPFSGIDWINYRGSDDNATIKIPDDQVKFFPKAPGVFERGLSPYESFDFVNTPGKEFYVQPVFDRDRNMFWRQEIYSYPLFICKRPDVLRTGYSEALPNGATQGGSDQPVESFVP